MVLVLSSKAADAFATAFSPNTVKYLGSIFLDLGTRLYLFCDEFDTKGGTE